MNLINKKIGIVIIVALLVALSWSGFSNKYSKQYIDNSIKNTAIVYATARGINAIVSVLQSSEFSVSFIGGVAIKVGEILDPVNDSIERFSEVVSFALVSLVLQKILANIVAQDLFNWLLTVVAIVFIATLYLKQNKYLAFFGKSLVLLVFTKFIFIVIILLNTALSVYYIDDDINNNHQKLEKFQNGMTSNAGQLTKDEKNKLKKKNKTLNKEINKLNKSIKNLETYHFALETNLAKEVKNRKGLLKKYHKNCQWFWFDSKSCDAIDIDIYNTKNNIDKIQRDIKLNQKAINQDNNAVRQRDKTIISNKGKINNTFQRSPLEEVKNFAINISEEKVEKYIANLFHLIVLFILKTIIFPLGFFLLLIKGFKYIWRLSWLDIVK